MVQAYFDNDVINSYSYNCFTKYGYESEDFCIITVCRRSYKRRNRTILRHNYPHKNTSFQMSLPSSLLCRSRKWIEPSKVIDEFVVTSVNPFTDCYPLRWFSKISLRRQFTACPKTLFSPDSQSRDLISKCPTNP